MKLINVLQNVDKSNPNIVNYSDLCSSLGLTETCYDHVKFSEGLKSYYFRSLSSTDTIVGAIYFLDYLVGCFSQNYKGEEDFQFLSIELAKKVSDFVISCTFQDDAAYGIISDDDLNCDITDFYTIT